MVLSHGTPMYRLVEDGWVDPGRYVQIGLRGYWPGEAEFAWQREHGITSLFAHAFATAASARWSSRRSASSARAACCSPSTWTCSTRLSRPAPARRSRAG